MVNKMGRPPSKNPKKNDTRIRLSDEELEMLNKCSEITGMTKADVIRTGIKKVYEGLKKK